MAAREAVAGLRTDGDAVAARVGNLADRLERVEVVGDDPIGGAAGTRGRRVGRGNLARRTARNEESAVGDIGVDVVPAAFAAHAVFLENFVRPDGPVREREEQDTKRGGRQP